MAIINAMVEAIESYRALRVLASWYLIGEAAWFLPHFQ
jgi:hypothetical protein